MSGLVERYLVASCYKSLIYQTLQSPTKSITPLMLLQYYFNMVENLNKHLGYQYCYNITNVVAIFTDRFRVAIVKATIERLSFFQSPTGGSLRFSEHFPPDMHKEEHFNCNCTKDVQDRPEGKPEECYLIIDYSDRLDNRDFSLRSWLPTELSFGFKWGTEGKTPDGWKIRDNRPHFDFRYFTQKGLLEVSELSNPEEFYQSWSDTKTLSHVDTDLHFTLCFGKADVSNIFMGHSPPNIVKVDQLEVDALWAYTHGFGEEHVEFLPKGSEHAAWWKLARDLTIAHSMLQAIHTNPQQPLEDLHRQANAEPLLQLITQQSKFLSETLNSLPTTEFFQKGHKTTQAGYKSLNR